MEVIFLCVYVLGPAVACDYILSSLYLNYANNVVDSILCSFKYPSFLVLQYVYVFPAPLVHSLCRDQMHFHT